MGVATPRSRMTFPYDPPMTSTTVIRALGFDHLTAREAHELLRLRQDVFVVEQECPYPDIDGRDVLASTIHVLMTNGSGELLGAARVLSEEGGLRLGRVVLARGARGTGLGRELTAAALDACGTARVRLDGQVRLEGFYASFGFAVSGPEFDEDGIAHVPMERPAQA